MHWKCLKCDEKFKRASMAREHYERAHDIRMVYESMDFETLEHFKTWKNDLQRKLVTQFVQLFSWKASNHTSVLFTCHRSGMYADRSKDERKRQRNMKRAGTKKLQGYCPAEILLKLGDGTCSVQFQSTHVGHAINTSEELRHIYLDAEQKLDIAAKLHDGVPCNEVLKQLNRSNGVDESSLSRLSIANYSDVYNVARHVGVENRFPLRFKPDEEAAAAAVGSLVGRQKDSILYYKGCGEPDTRFGLLRPDDFAVVLMDKGQARNLARYAHKAVAFDSAAADRFVLHALLVSDVNCVDVPVAFLLANRDDRAVVDVLVRCVRERVGPLETRTLVSNGQPAYADSWSRLMNAPQRHVLCAWRVNEAWRRALNRLVADRARRDDVWRELRALAEEPREDAFRRRLNAFVARGSGDDDDDGGAFARWFDEHYGRNCAQWAYCYRGPLAVGDNLHIEGVRRLLKQNGATTAADNPSETLLEGLKCVEAYMASRETERLTKQLRGGYSTRRDQLRKNHRRAVQRCGEAEVSVVRLDERTWQVAALQRRPDGDLVALHTVDRVEEPKECAVYDDVFCQLVCEECGVCFHEYRCSCADSAVHANLCEHVHLLGIYLRNEPSAASDKPVEDVVFYSCEYVDNLVKAEDAKASDNEDDAEHRRVSNYLVETTNIFQPVEFKILGEVR